MFEGEKWALTRPLCNVKKEKKIQLLIDLFETPLKCNNNRRGDKKVLFACLTLLSEGR